MGRRKKIKPEFSPELLDEAAKAGFSKEQIATFTDTEALRQAVARFSPQILSSAGTPSEPKKPAPPVEMEIKTLQDRLDLSAMVAKTSMRADAEQRRIDDILNRYGIRQQLVRIEIERDYEPSVNGRFLTLFTLRYKGPKA